MAAWPREGVRVEQSTTLCRRLDGVDLSCPRRRILLRLRGAALLGEGAKGRSGRSVAAACCSRTDPSRSEADSLLGVLSPQRARDPTRSVEGAGSVRVRRELFPDAEDSTLSCSPAPYTRMTLLHTPTRFNPRLLARNPLLAKSLQLSTPPFARRSFAAFAPLQQPQPSPPARSEDNGHHSYQPHFKDGKDAPVSTSWSSSRPHEAWTMVTTVYTPEDVEAVKVVRLERKTITDKLAYGMVKFARWGFDLVTGESDSAH